MRIVSALLVLAALTTLAGCGSGPAPPAQVTSEEERQLKEDQKNVDTEEQKQQAAQKAPKELSPEGQVEAEERGRQRR